MHSLILRVSDLMIPFYALGIGLVKAPAGGDPSAGEGGHRTNRT
ncbi:MAG TPA: hypothetical protein QGG30_05155 [Acidobacteriota bacterium]|nr:hypothetical protein [Acidobacteriota bacterium]